MVRGAPCWSQHSSGSPQEGGGVLGQPSGSQFANAISSRTFERGILSTLAIISLWNVGPKGEVLLFSTFRNLKALRALSAYREVLFMVFCKS